MQPITITLNEIKSFSPCKDGWEKLLKSLNKTQADDTPVTFSYIAYNNSVADALWCFRVLSDKYLKERCYLMADIAESVTHLYTKDNRVSECIQAIRDYGGGKITKEELIKKRIAAVDADDSAFAVAASASATFAASAIADSDSDSADAAAHAAAHAAASSSAFYDSAFYEEKEKQKEFIKKHLG